MHSYNLDSRDVDDLNSFSNFSWQVAEYDMLQQITNCKFLSFHSSVEEASVLLWYDNASLVLGSKQFKATILSQNVRKKTASDAASFHRRINNSGQNLFFPRSHKLKQVLLSKNSNISTILHWCYCKTPHKLQLYELYKLYFNVKLKV